MGERLAAGNVAMALLANTLATGAALVTLILTSARFPVLISTRLLHWPMPARAVSGGQRYRDTSQLRSVERLRVCLPRT